MNIYKKIIFKALIPIIAALFLFECIVFKQWGCTKDFSSSSEKKITFPAFELPVPQNKMQKNYLGLLRNGNFKVTEIKARILIIEVFSMYCPHCQKEAPIVNELYRTIEKKTDVKEKVKIIGIGVGNTPFEVNLFKKKYEVPFPLFSDKDLSVTRLLGAKTTPTFIGIIINEDGTYHNFYFKSGPLGNVPQFIEMMLTLSKIEKKD
jgi:thiol-disulfide isomerase/thioredoxin